MTRLPVLLLPLLLGGCLSAMAPNQNTARVRLGDTAALGVIRVVPLQVVEDSRCPQGTQCVWAGRLRLRASVEPPYQAHERTLILGEPQQVSGGTLLLEEATPYPRPDRPIPPGDYTFVLRYTMPSPR